MQLEALLFDVDGTLSDTERDGHRVAFNLAFKDAGLDWDWDEELYGDLLTVTGGKERMDFYIEKYRPDFKKPDDYSGFLKKMHAAKTEHFTRMLKDGVIGLRPGVKRLIAEARAQGLRLAVVTTTTPANVEALLTAALAPDAMSWFECIAAGDIVPAKKPAPDIYFWALDKMKLKPEQCVALEDSGNGIKSSLGAKVKTVITINGYTRDEDFTGASVVVDNMGEPGAPCQVISGSLGGQTLINVAALRYIHAH
ncbi:MAG: HAD family hydrolase [Gammaproteobacteria bacterium]|nr:HAD family hydrolase [Gammaproteobacteria bacterium]